MKKRIALVILAVTAVTGASAAGVFGWRFYQEEKAYEVHLEQLKAYAGIRQSGDVSAMYDADGILIVPVDFENLQRENPDIYAWITIPGVVDEPVLQSSADDAYYQNHDAEKKESSKGAIFSESLNDMDFSDPLTVLYGKNAEDGTLFGGLFQYRDRQFLEEHPTVYIYTPDCVREYRIFAAYQSDNRHLLMRFNQGTYEGNVKAFIKDILSQRVMDATVDREADIDAGDRFLTLSTHDPDGEEYRYLVQAYLKAEYM